MKSKILQLQKEYLNKRLSREIKKAKSQEEADAIINEFFRRYYVNVGRPLTLPQYMEEGHLPFLEDYNSNIEELHNDVSILLEETGLIGDAMSHFFNYAQNERARIRNRIHQVASFTNDLSLIANDNTKNAIHFKDSFNNRDLIESSMIIGTPADIATEEGVAMLRRSSVINQSKAASIKLLEGDGTKGTHHIAKQRQVQTDSEDYSENAVYISDESPNDDPNVILDGRPDTLFEYQNLNTNRENIDNIAKGYDFEWVQGDKYGERLRLRLIIELEDEKQINWININPYHPPNSTGSLKVYSIRTSVDGFEYQPLYDVDDYVLNAELNIVPQTYRADQLFTGGDDFRKSKFAGQGVWPFPARTTRFVEIVIDQDQSYEELIGHTYYEQVTITKDPDTNEDVENRVRIPSSQVSQEILKAPNGRYTVGESGGYIDKKLEVFPGWRYAIGIRDINIMSYEYEKKSEIISKKHETKRPIRYAMLYANEKIPQEFLSIISQGNDWIKYYVSYDDVNWYRISPMHHRPLSSEEEFPPKILEFNTTKVEYDADLQIHKEQVLVEKPIKGLRVKAIMSRPDGEGMNQLTPIIEDYSLKVVLDEE